MACYGTVNLSNLYQCVVNYYLFHGLGIITPRATVRKKKIEHRVARVEESISFLFNKRLQVSSFSDVTIRMSDLIRPTTTSPGCTDIQPPIPRRLAPNAKTNLNTVEPRYNEQILTVPPLNLPRCNEHFVVRQQQSVKTTDLSRNHCVL